MATCPQPPIDADKLNQLFEATTKLTGAFSQQQKDPNPNFDGISPPERSFIEQTEREYQNESGDSFRDWYRNQLISHANGKLSSLFETVQGIEHEKEQTQTKLDDLGRHEATMGSVAEQMRQNTQWKENAAAEFKSKTETHNRKTGFRMLSLPMRKTANRWFYSATVALLLLIGILCVVYFNYGEIRNKIQERFVQGSMATEEP